MSVDYWKFLDELDVDEAMKHNEEKDTLDYIDEGFAVKTSEIEEASDYYPSYPTSGVLGLNFYLEDTVEASEIGCGSSDIEHPAHYTSGSQEAIDTIEDAVKDAPDAVLGGLQWNTLKYLLRLWLKGNPKKDAQKASWYLNRLIEKL